MYEDHSEIPIQDLATCAEHDISQGKSQGKYILCLRVNSDSIYSKSLRMKLITRFSVWIWSRPSLIHHV